MELPGREVGAVAAVAAIFVQQSRVIFRHKRHLRVEVLVTGHAEAGPTFLQALASLGLMRVVTGDAAGDQRTVYVFGRFGAGLDLIVTTKTELQRRRVEEFGGI